MLTFTRIEHASGAELPALSVTLDHNERRRARLRVVLSSGAEAGIVVPRGMALRDGDRLVDETGLVVVVRARPELVSIATTPDPHLLARAAYHLGNRHVPLAIEVRRVLYPHDHVLDGLCRELGLEVTSALEPFEPELGGHAGHHRHEKRAEHGRGHEHAHPHGHARSDHEHEAHHAHDATRAASRASPPTAAGGAVAPASRGGQGPPGPER